MVSLDDLRLFVQAVESGGFAAAARRIGAPKSTISKRVAALETDLGARLIHRTSRSFLLTDPGRDFYGHARAALIEAEAAEDVVRRRLAEPSGTVRITASVPTAQFQLAARLPALAEAYPKLLLQLHVTDRFVDLVHEGFDIAVRSHFSALPDSGLIQRRLSAEAIILVAAPLYVARRGAPEAPADLAAHDGLLVGGDAVAWRLADAAGLSVTVSPRPRLIADESMVLMQAASAGLGIACLPESMTRAAIGQGALVRILPGCTAGVVTTTMLTTHRRGQLPAVRAVMDFLAA